MSLDEEGIQRALLGVQSSGDRIVPYVVWLGFIAGVLAGIFW